MACDLVRLENLINDLRSDLQETQSELAAKARIIDELAAWKAERSKPIVITFDPAAFDDSPRRHQERAREIVSKALDK